MLANRHFDKVLDETRRPGSAPPSQCDEGLGSEFQGMFLNQARPHMPTLAADSNSLHFQGASASEDR